MLLHEAKKEFYPKGGFGAGQLTDDSSSNVNVAEELESVDEVDGEEEKE